jgi:hypothetical protein
MGWGKFDFVGRVLPPGVGLREFYYESVPTFGALVAVIVPC